MKIVPRPAVAAAVALLAALVAAAAGAQEKTEVRGAAILDHPCGKTALRHMGLLHAGKYEEAWALATPQVREHWDAMPEGQRKAIFRALRDMSEAEGEFSAEIQRLGVLVVEGDAATLTVEKTTKTENGSMTETLSQRFVLDGGACLIAQ